MTLSKGTLIAALEKIAEWEPHHKVLDEDFEAMRRVAQKALEEPEFLYYRSGQDRNEPNALTHTYAEFSNGELWPMCTNGWNRAGGDRFSIFRGVPDSRGDCLTCLNNIARGREPFRDGGKRKTKWL